MCLESNSHESFRLKVVVEYYPRRQDSHVELVKPESSFLEFFKQSLVYTSKYCTDSNCCSFLGHTASAVASGTDQQHESNTSLGYPLALFANLQDIPPPAVLHHLAQGFQDGIFPSTAFLSKVTALKCVDKHSFELLLCKALLGAATSNNPQYRDLSDRLWHASANLVTGTVEVDNSLGRRIEWLSAVSILFVSLL